MAQSSLGRSTGQAARPSLPSSSIPPLHCGVIKLLPGKQSHGPGEEGGQDCGGQLDKMVCVKLSPATISLSKRMDLEVLSLSREDVFFYTSAATGINLLSKRGHLLN